MRSALVCLAFFFSVGVFAQENNPKKQDNGPKDASFAKFEETVHNFGTIKYGEEAIFAFVFTNTSKKVIAVKSVQRSCGCTTPSYSTEPVKAGEKGEIKAKYDTTREGYFKKHITVTFADGSVRRLTITGTVLPKPEGESGGE